MNNLEQEVKIFQRNMDCTPKYKVNDAVFALNFGRGAKSVPGIIVKVISPRNFEVQV